MDEEAKYLGLVNRRALVHRLRRARHGHEPPPDGGTREQMAEVQKLLFRHDLVETGRWLLEFMPDPPSADGPGDMVITADGHV